MVIIFYKGDQVTGIFAAKEVTDAQTEKMAGDLGCSALLVESDKDIAANIDWIRPLMLNTGFEEMESWMIPETTLEF